MLTLYIAITIMLIISLSIVSIPFINNKQLSFSKFLPISILLCLSALILYEFSGNKLTLQQWLSHGKEHYQLQLEVERLGGIDALIKRVQAKLETNPNDAQGWLILGKLYLGKHDEKSAKAAFQRAKALSL